MLLWGKVVRAWSWSLSSI